jgi:hypothetical protein
MDKNRPVDGAGSRYDEVCAGQRHDILTPAPWVIR